MADPTLDDANPVPKRRVYSDGTDGTAATPLPVMAQQNINTASALPTTNAQGVVQPNTAPAAPTLSSASPVAPPPPAIMPVAAPAAAAAATAPVTPTTPAVPDPNLSNHLTPVVTTTGASQIPGIPAAQAAKDAAYYAAHPELKPGQEPLISGDTLHAINSVAGALPPQAGAPIRGAVGAVNFLGRTLAGEKAAVLGKTVASGTTDAAGTTMAATADAAKTGWNSMSAGQKAFVGGAAVADTAIPAAAIYQAGDPGPVPGKNQNGYPNTMGAPLNDPTPVVAPGAATPSLNNVTRTGNSYTGGPNIAGGITVNGQQPGGNTVGLGGTSPTPEQAAAAHTANMAGIASDSQAIKDKLAAASANDVNLGNVTMDAGRTGGDDYKKFTEEANLNTAKQATGWSARGGTTVNAPALKAATDVMDARAKRDAENLRAGNELAKTRLTTQAENARAAATNAITMRGQDTTATSALQNTLATIRGQDSKSKSEQEKLDYEKMKNDRQWKLDAVKTDTSTATDQYKIRQESMDNVIKAATRQRPTVNGKPDTDGAARDAAAVSTYIADLQTKMETALKADPTNKDISNKLDRIKKFGARELDQTDIDRVIKGNQASELATAAQNQTLGTRVWQGTQGGTTSDKPVEHLVKQVRPGMPDIYLEADASGNPVKGGRILPAESVEGNQGWLNTGVFAQPNANLQNIIVRR